MRSMTRMALKRRASSAERDGASPKAKQGSLARQTKLRAMATKAKRTAAAASSPRPPADDEVRAKKDLMRRLALFYESHNASHTAPKKLAAVASFYYDRQDEVRGPAPHQIVTARRPQRVAASPARA